MHKTSNRPAEGLYAVLVHGFETDELQGGPGSNYQLLGWAIGITDDKGNMLVPILAMEEVETAYYLRMQALDQAGVMAKVAGILGDAGISIEAMQQKQPLEGETEVPLVMLTHNVLERQMNEAIEKIEALDVIRAGVTRIRVESLAAD